MWHDSNTKLKGMSRCNNGITTQAQKGCHKKATNHGVILKTATADKRYFARSTLSRSLVHKKGFALIWQGIFQLEYLFYQGRKDIEFKLTQRNITYDNYSL